MMPDNPTDEQLRIESIAISELARGAMSDAESDGAPYHEADRQRVCRFFAVLRKRMGWAKRSAPTKPAILVAPPADERDAVRLIVDAIATEIIDPAALYAELRPVLARLARDAFVAGDDLPTCEYAADLRHAARTLERADARRTWARTKILRRSDYMSRNSVSNFRRVILGEMRDAVKLFHGVDR